MCYGSPSRENETALRLMTFSSARTNWLLSIKRALVLIPDLRGTKAFASVRQYLPVLCLSTLAFTYRPSWVPRGSGITLILGTLETTCYEY